METKSSYCTNDIYDLIVEDLYVLSVEKLNIILSEERKSIDQIEDKLSGLRLLFINEGIDNRSKMIKLKTVIRKKRKNVSKICSVLNDKYIQAKKERIKIANNEDRMFLNMAREYLPEADFFKILEMAHTEIKKQGD